MPRVSGDRIKHMGKRAYKEKLPQNMIESTITAVVR